ncbi:alkene reductase [Flavobacteriaceae bacterium TP-CH-4]|uniref:Alkene reductase n=1 Tax=Pelagihabitans pacificus TaxID=2696054 RepID=A0A967ANZ8_9FLAO|nr:alkene reductase [Pelagihabitans pacificus]NHF57816.1 alkene reductase [Pelagihabitans pacificus]
MKLFEKYSLGSITLQNRMVMAPMTRSRAINNIPNELMATYYAQRAGAGLIITEGTSPSPNGLGYARIPGVYNDLQVEGWKKVTSAVHDKGGKIFLQIMHTGRVSHPDNMPQGSTVLAPSAVILEDQMYTDQHGMQPYPEPKAMDGKDIAMAIEEYVQAARNAIKAGFDGVEIHAANGYLIDQFLNPITNKRTDEYGGSIENRNRFAIEVATGIAQAIGADKTGIRISPYGAFNGLGEFEGVNDSFISLATALDDLGLVYLHLVDHSSMGAPEVPDSIKNGLRKAFSRTFILSGGYDQERAEQDLSAGKGDLVAFGRPFIANPDLPERLKEDLPLQEPNQDTFYTADAEGYTDYDYA